MSTDRAAELSGSDPDYAIRDLYDAIESGDFPEWTCYIQVMTFEQAEKFRFNPFDVTKVFGNHNMGLGRCCAFWKSNFGTTLPTFLAMGCHFGKNLPFVQYGGNSPPKIKITPPLAQLRKQISP